MILVSKYREHEKCSIFIFLLNYGAIGKSGVVIMTMFVTISIDVQSVCEIRHIIFLSLTYKRL